MMQKFRVAMKQTQDERGFTLVELLMVMVIIGVLVGLGFTGFRALQDRSAKAQADVYWRDLNTAVGMMRVSGEGVPKDIEDLAGYLDINAAPWNDLSSVADEGVNVTVFEGEEEDGVKVCVWVNGQVASGAKDAGCGDSARNRNDLWGGDSEG